MHRLLMLLQPNCSSLDDHKKFLNQVLIENETLSWNLECFVQCQIQIKLLRLRFIKKRKQLLIL